VRGSPLVGRHPRHEEESERREDVGSHQRDPHARRERVEEREGRQGDAADAVVNRLQAKFELMTVKITIFERLPDVMDQTQVAKSALWRA
jgi:hypothetical protein